MITYMFKAQAMRMGALLGKIIELPTPWMTLESTSVNSVEDTTARTVEMVKSHIPRMNIFLRPCISATLPKGRTKTA